MDARRENEPTPTKNRTTVERKSERELVVTRTFNAPARIVFDAWTKPELSKRWWAPKSMGMSLLSCEMDVRGTGRASRHPGRERGTVMKGGAARPGRPGSHAGRGLPGGAVKFDRRRSRSGPRRASVRLTFFRSAAACLHVPAKLTLEP